MAAAADDDDNTILPENGIFHSESQKGLCCFLCPKNTAANDWRKHIENPSHTSTLERFNHEFERRNKRVYCKLCNYEFDWHELTSHAYWDKMVPWYVPEKKYKTFFENEILEWEARFYCYPCDAIFPEWSTTFAHLPEEIHRSLIKAGPPLIDTPPFTAVETLYELLISEGFVPYSQTTVKCRICNCCDIQLRDIFSHIRSTGHAKLKKKFVSTLREKKKYQVVEKQTENLSLVTENPADNSGIIQKSLSSEIPAEDKMPDHSNHLNKNSPNVSLPAAEKPKCIYLVQQSATGFYCKVCSIKLIGQSSVDYHIESLWHVTALKTFGCDRIFQKENNECYCEHCNCVVPDRERVFLHIKEKEHNRLLSSNYILRLNNTEHCCKICNVLLSDLVLIDDHIAGKLHETSLKSYGCDRNISLMDDERFYCQCCDYVIPSPRDISLHTSSVGHRAFLNLTVKQEEPQPNKINIETASTQISETSSQISNSFYIATLNDTDFHCKICNLVLFGQASINDHIVGEQHTKAYKRFGCNNIILNKDNTYYCKTCKCKIFIPERIFIHIKGVQHTTRHAELENTKFPAVKLEPFQINGSQAIPSDSSGKANNGDILPKTHDELQSIQTTSTEKEYSMNLDKFSRDEYISPLGGNKYYCKCCKSVIPRLENIYGHTTSTRHQSFISGSARRSTDQSRTSDPQSPCCYIVKMNSTDFYCKICDLWISDQNLNEHARGEQHAAAFKQYGCYNITLQSGVDYHCKSCNCRIPGLANVYLHIKGPRHMESSSAASNASQKQEASNKVNTQQPIVQNASQTFPQRFDPNLNKELNDFQTTVEDRNTVQVTASRQFHGDAYITAIGPNTFRCTCCDCVIPNFDNIYVHVTGSRHKAFLKETTRQSMAPRPSPICCYIICFNNTDYCCKICDLMIPDQNLNEHATGEQHAAAFKRYGCDNISLQRGIDYYCKSCNCKIPGLSNVYLHIKGPRHMRSSSAVSNASEKQDANNKLMFKVSTQQQLLQNASQTVFQRFDPNSSKQSNDSQKTGEDRNTVQGTAWRQFSGDASITAIGPNKYCCTCCNCIIPDFDNIYVHITGNSHKTFLKKTTGQQMAARPSPICCYIMQLSDTDFHCRVCDLSLSDQATVRDHANGEQHTMALKRYNCRNITPNNDGTYFCKSCKCKIPSLANVYLHIKGPRHMNPLSKPTFGHEKLELAQNNLHTKRNGDSRQLANRYDHTSEIVLSDYIVQVNGTQFDCKICCLTIIGQDAVEDHLKQNTHALARDKYGCDNISTLPKGKFHCRCCNCDIPNLENVHRHVVGRNHCANVAKNRETVSKEHETSNRENGEASKKSDVLAVLHSQDAGPSSLPDNADSNGTKDTKKPLSRYSSLEKQLKDFAEELSSSCNAHDAELQSPSTSSLKPVNQINDRSKAIEKKRISDYWQSMPEVEAPLAIQDTKLSSEGGAQHLSMFTPSKFSDRSNERINTDGNDRGILVSPASSIISSRTISSGRKPRIPKKTNLQNVLEIFDSDNDHIHDMKDKYEEMKLGMNLCFVKNDKKEVYCLVCRRETNESLDNYIDHLRNFEHCENLEEMESTHALFKTVEGQFSDYVLALQYMEEISEGMIVCRICADDIENVDDAVRNHMCHTIHKQNCTKQQIKMKRYLNEMMESTHCNWYDIHKYRCELCSANFQSEFDFANHLKSTSHSNVMTKTVDNKEKLFYDVCAACSVLWYGCRTTYAYHCEDPKHKWIVTDGHAVSPDLPKSAELLLSSSDNYLKDMISYSSEIYLQESMKEKALICDLETVVKVPFPNAKIYMFGSRAENLWLPDSGIDLFIDSGNMYFGNDMAKDRTMAFINSIHQCLKNDSQSWKVIQFGMTCRTNLPIIKAMHRATGLFCDICFENGLGVENTKIIKGFNNTCSGCRNMTLFLKQWLKYCDLSGTESISSYALCWCVIFFLQRESILPSIATVMDTKELRKIAGWPFGATSDCGFNKIECPFNFEQLLIRFFAYYTDFDYRHDVICPLIGDVVKKRAFVDPQNLPKEMAAYLTYVRTSHDPEPFRIDSPMCVQDPFDLQRNLTEDVNKVHLSRFRNFCAKSLGLLRPSC